MLPPIMPFKDLKVLVTRPVERAQALAALLNQSGAIVTLYPVITISDCENPEQLNQQLQQLSEYDLAIFISPTAVIKSLARIESFPENLSVAAIGSSTAQTLKNFDIKIDVQSNGHNSESLLQRSALQAANIKNKRIIIIRGQGGRELLSDTLQARGAEVTYVECYRRQITPGLASLSDQQLKDLDIIMITSNEGLQNLYELTENKPLLIRTPLLVPGERTRQLAFKLGFDHVTLAENATDEASLRALASWDQPRR